MGNYIGLNAAGTAAVGTNNQTVAANGILVQEAAYTVIGTDGDGVGDALEGNLISGNSDFGVMLQQTGALNNVFAGNKIGTVITGMSAIPNGYSGSPRGGIVLGGDG